MNVIKQYGLERCGTNYIKALIDLNTKNTRVLSNLFGLKHEKFEVIDYQNYHPKNDVELAFGKYTDITDNELNNVKKEFKNNNVNYIVSVKNPYSWVISYNACHWIPKRHGFGLGPLNLDKVKKYLDRWNSVNQNWIDNLPSDNTFFVLYEDLISNPKQIITDICDKFNITMNDGFRDIHNNMGMMPDVHGSKNIMKNKFDKINHYLNKEYMKDLSDDIVKYIESNMNNNIIKNTK